MIPLIILRGGGDLASGAALRLHRSGYKVVILELGKPLSVRRSVSFSEAVYEGLQTVEGVRARAVSADQFQHSLQVGEIPVLIDPQAGILRNQFLTSPQHTIVIDARMLKSSTEPLPAKCALFLGLGPGFVAGVNCDAVIETRRGHTLGRVYWKGSALTDSGQPDGDPRRVLRAPHEGRLTEVAKIGDILREGDLVAELNGSGGAKTAILSPIQGVLRGLIRSGVDLPANIKIGDIDPRGEPESCFLVSDKALAIGGAVLEAIQTRFPPKFEVD